MKLNCLMLIRTEEPLIYKREVVYDCAIRIQYVDSLKIGGPKASF